VKVNLLDCPGLADVLQCPKKGHVYPGKNYFFLIEGII
jgi:hypothetical protein